MIYLDNAATTRVCDVAVNAAQNAMQNSFGNPSSLHRLGIEAETIVKNAREHIAGVLHADKNEIFFTSGGTEGNNLAIFGIAYAKKRRGKHIITSAVEHASVLSPMHELEKEGFTITYLAPEDITIDGVINALQDDTILISIMSVNNETGIRFPIPDIARMVKRIRPGVVVHTDAVQAFLKIPISLRDGAIDLMTISGHKVHAPKGIGALYIKKDVRIIPRNFGGGQERALRPGTENVPSIAAFGAAVREGCDTQKMAKVLAYLKNELLKIPSIKILADGNAPHILSIAIEGYPSEVAMRMLESRDIYVSSGSACSKGRRSHVLEALHVPAKLIDSALRISISEDIDEKLVDDFCATIREMFIKP